MLARITQNHRKVEQAQALITARVSGPKAESMQGNRKTKKKPRKCRAKISKVLYGCYSKTCSGAISSGGNNKAKAKVLFMTLGCAYSTRIDFLARGQKIIKRGGQERAS